MEEITKLNQRLRFSWGHIFAFIAIILVGYTSFVGFTYLTRGNFIFGAIGMGVTVLVFIFVFITAQQLKASDYKISRKIKWERFLILISPLVFAAGMIAMSHFWTVQSQNDIVVSNFNNALNHGKGIFADYEKYADNRISKYDAELTQIIEARESNPELYLQAGFSPEIERLQKENMVEVLRLQLYNSNYDSLKNLAVTWIDKANNGASAYNVFLLGNTREISQALTNWQKKLQGFTTKKLSNEELVNPVEEFKSNSGTAAAKEIDALGQSFTVQKFPTVYAIIFGVFIYFMMIFPYLIQERHSKSMYSLFGRRREVIKTSKKNTQKPEPRPAASAPKGKEPRQLPPAQQPRERAPQTQQDKYKEDKDFPLF